jgi:hypothetical protein
MGGLVNAYALELLCMALVLIVFALAGLIYTAYCARRSALGSRLLEVCGGDWETARLAIENVRLENELMAEMIGKTVPPPTQPGRVH